MSSRLTRNPAAHHHGSHTAEHVGELAGQDRDLKWEDALHHSENHSHPHAPKHPSPMTIRALNPQPPHHPQHHPNLPPVHDTHSHLHGDELPKHTNQPSPIKPEKKITKTGIRK